MRWIDKIYSQIMVFTYMTTNHHDSLPPHMKAALPQTKQETVTGRRTENYRPTAFVRLAKVVKHSDFATAILATATLG